MQVPVTLAERELVHTLADQAGCSLAQYVRGAVAARARSESDHQADQATAA